MRIGLLGLGTMGAMYARVIAEHPLASLAAVCDLDPARLDGAARAYGARPYDDIHQMLAAERLDGLVVALPDHLHEAAVVAAASRSVHLLVEKPLATEADAAERMCAAVEAAGVQGYVGFIFRYNPPFVASRQAVGQGRIGQLFTVNARMLNRITVPTQMLPWAARSSPSWFLLSHAVDATRWLTGREVRAVRAQGSKGKLQALGIDTYDFIRLLLQLEGGATACLEACWTLPESQPMVADARFSLLGSEGLLEIQSGNQMVTAIGPAYEHLRTLQVEVDGKLYGIYPAMVDGFVRALTGETAAGSSLATMADGQRNTRILTAADRSLVSGAEEALDQ